MGRKKKNKKKNIMNFQTKEEKSLVLAESRVKEMEEEETFFIYCEMMEAKIPYVFQNWKNFFTDRTSFLQAARKWASEMEVGIPETIITDAIKGKNTYNKNLERSGRVWGDEESLFGYNEMYSTYGLDETIEKDYWEYCSRSQNKVKPRYKFYERFTKSLPLKPKIESPKGKSVGALVSL
jgi:hypothetical protein